MLLQKLNDTDLLAQTENLCRKEREILTDLLHHFREIQKRRLYSDLGYKSLFEMLTKKYRYSEDQAYRRISAMKLLAEMPEIETKISRGEINLTHLNLAQTLFKQEAHLHKEEISRDDKLQVLDSFANKSTREAEVIARSFASAPEELRPDQVRVVTESKIELRFLASASLREKVTTLQGWLAHRSPNLGLGELFEKLCDLGLQEWNPAQPAAPRKRRVKPTSAQATSRRALRRKVFERSGGGCENCGSKYALEIDHIQPRAKGGASDLANLRILCRNCNQRAAIHEFGLRKMAEFLKEH